MEQKPLLVVLLDQAACQYQKARAQAVETVVRTVVARISRRKLSSIKPTTRLPRHRCLLMEMLDKEAGDLFRYAYTGEALTVGKLSEVLLGCLAKQN
jgi:hypothetical protein